MSTKSQSKVQKKAEKPSSSQCDSREQPGHDYNNFSSENRPHEHNRKDVASHAVATQSPTTSHVDDASSFLPYSSYDNVQSKYRTTRNNHGQCGLDNLGNTCFMNAILQCLNNVPPFAEHYLHLKGKFSPSGSRSVSETFADLVQSMRKSDIGRPEALKHILCKYYAPQFRGYDQQDSHEFLTVLLDALHQESIVEAVDGEEQSIITDLFRGQMEYTIKCSAALQCKNVTISTDSFMDLPLFIEEIVSPISTSFKFRFVSLDGHEKICDFSFSLMDTIQSVIDHFQQSSSNSFSTSIVAMKISANNMFSCQYRSSTALEKIDDQSTIFYEIEGDPENPATICYFCEKSSSVGRQLYHHPPLLLKLPKQNAEGSLHTCLSNHFGLVALIYEVNYHSTLDISFPCLGVHYEKPIIIAFDEKTMQHLRSTSERTLKNSTRYIRTESSVTLERCLTNNISVVERMATNKTWFCPNCQKDRQLTNENRILSLPKVLIIHLKRFDIESRPPRAKIETFVKYPLVLNMTKFLPATSCDEQIYDLIGVCLHSGSLTGGHYIAYAKNSRDWFRFNDSCVSQISANDVVSANAYILFYLKRSC
jgi:ubiquitin C-terminal hydrolase